MRGAYLALKAASAVFFTGLYFYLHSGNEPGKKSEHASHGFSTNVRDDNKAEPDDGLTAKLMYSSSDDSKATNEDVQDSTRKAISADAPNSAYGAEEGKSGSQPASDVKDSIARGFASDNPKTSYQAEKDQAGDGWVDVGTTDSIKKSLAADAPKTAKKVEEGRAVASTAR
ncbi:hypothetical protein FRC03_012207 [Tulasnella sp. 419]|nr:hypothetical protein FRC03_012207 [Tulasnella sp. 419]